MQAILYIYLFIMILFGQPSYSVCTPDNQRIDAHRITKVITNPERSDGFGAQFQTIIIAVIYAELNNMKYVYTPFRIMEHNYDNDSDFIAKKEWLINFIDNFEINNGSGIKLHETHCIQFFDANISACANSSSLQQIKKIFRANKKTINYFNNENLNIAIHIRRPNSHDNRILGTDTPDNVFLNIINQLRMVYAAQNPLFHLYSQGNSENFKMFAAPDSLLHLNESVEDTFIPMVLADILVTSASSFSYTAGILSDGIVYYIPSWCTPLPHWISADTLLKK